jgi:energy-converting hydrogenase Eha subunit A
MALERLQDAWWSWFPPAEVREAVAAVDALFHGLAGSAPHAQARAALARARLSLPILRQDRPERVVVVTAVNAMLGYLASGQAHIYRGVLGMDGEAVQVRFNQVLATAAIQQIITADELRGWHETLQARIRNAG